MPYLKSQLYFPATVAFHAVLWGIDLALRDGPVALVAGESAPQRVLGEFLSSWVVTVIGFNLLMTTRCRWVERVFGGLDKMYLIHRRSGMIIAVLLLLHFAVVPRHPDFTIGKPLGFAALALMVLGVAFAAAPLMKRLLPYHQWVKGHRLMGAFYVVGLVHAATVTSLLEQMPLVRAYVIGMAAVGVGSWLYRAFLFRRIHKPLAYRVSAVARRNATVTEITMAPVGEALDHDAGQFAFFSFKQHHPNESHPFTVASAPGAETLRVIVKASGDFTASLVAGVKPGDEVDIEGPYGHLTQRQLRSEDQLWVAGGIGVTPFLSLAHALADAGRRATLHWVVASADEAVVDGELRALADAVDGFDYRLWSSAEMGRFTASELGEPESIARSELVVCGPVSLRDALAKQLRSLVDRPPRIHSEEFSFR